LVGAFRSTRRRSTKTRNWCPPSRPSGSGRPSEGVGDMAEANPIWNKWWSEQSHGGSERESITSSPSNDNSIGTVSQRAATAAPVEPVPRSISALPDDAHAVIERPSRSVTQSGRALERGWRLRFLPRRERPTDPLTGWSGSSDPLAHIALSFPTREAAIRYAERQGISYEVREPERGRSRVSGSVSKAPHEPLWLCCWPTGPHALCCGRYPLLKGRANHAS
jgi:hypothetical protein